MNQEQFNKAKQNQEKMLSAISEGLENKLELTMVLVPDLKERLLRGLRWSFFLSEEINLPTQTKLTASNNKRDFSPLITIDGNEVLESFSEIKKHDLLQVGMFIPEVESGIKNKIVEISLSYEDCETLVLSKVSSAKNVNVEEFFKYFELQLTLPGVDEVFDGYNLDSLSKIQLEAMDEFEHWRWDVGNKVHAYPYLQIGGNGHWIQGDYSDSYFAQVNNDIGDAGSVYILYSDDGDFQSWVDMY
jgi:hypothetical protein